MIDLHYWTTPNGHKITLFLEETGLDYRIVPVNIGKGEQFKPEFLQIAPNNRIPAIIDHRPLDSGDPISVFESGAILLYLADKTGKLIPQDLRGRTEALEWLFWQMAGLGPMAGQNGHFNHAAPEKLPYAISRYERETARLFAVLDKRLKERDFLAGAGRGEYSVADIASYPWTRNYARLNQDIEQFPNLERWQTAIAARPATERAYALSDKINPPKPPVPLTDEERQLLYGQDAKTVRG
ncbi:MAG: glutathione binding-like protein [Pseudomonadota bacterium]